jgi:hypothetical protein
MTAAITKATNAKNLVNASLDAYNQAVTYLGANADPTGGVLTYLVNCLAENYGGNAGGTQLPATAQFFPSTGTVLNSKHTQ